MGWYQAGGVVGMSAGGMCPMSSRIGRYAAGGQMTGGFWMPGPVAFRSGHSPLIHRLLSSLSQSTVWSYRGKTRNESVGAEQQPGQRQ